MSEETAPTSNLRGVRWDKARQRWRAEVQINGRRITLGRFDTEEAAAAAYVARKLDSVQAMTAPSIGAAARSEMPAMTELEHAMRLVREAEQNDPEQVMRIEMARTVEGIDFVAEASAHAASTISMAAQDPRNSHITEKQEASHAAQLARDEYQRQQLAASREELVRYLGAGQSPASQAMVKATISGGA